MAGGYGRRKGNGAGQGSAGDGWGGPPKGASTAKPRAAAFTSKTATEAARIRLSQTGLSKAEIRARRTEEIEAMLFGLVLEAEREETKVSAGKALHAIYNGQPVARNITLNADDISDLTDDQLREELARGSGTSTADQAGVASPGVSSKPSGILH